MTVYNSCLRGEVLDDFNFLIYIFMHYWVLFKDSDSFFTIRSQIVKGYPVFGSWTLCAGSEVRRMVGVNFSTSG